jgi:cob(I)alamin adenosyltransferase
MVKLTKIYTRGGDGGETSLADGERVPKYDLRIEAYGTVDEANAAIGIARLHTQGEADAMLGRIQNDLFDLGADLATPGEDFSDPAALRVVEAQVERLEAEIDAMNAKLKPLESFILPGGSPAAAHLHLARTITRRAERLIAELFGVEPVNPAALRYANRLSDHLFVLGRHLNQDGAADVLWVPGANR